VDCRPLSNNNLLSIEKFLFGITVKWVGAQSHSEIQHNLEM